MSVELGSFWLIKDGGCIATVKSIIAKANGGATVVYTLTDSNGTSSYRMSCEYELFTNIAEKLITKSELKDELNKEYVRGKTEGYNEGCQHGFTLAKEDITKLNEQERQQIYYEGYDSGHNQWQNDYGFTIPNNTIKNLEATNYKKGLKDKAQINEAVKQNIANKAFKEGYAQAYSEINAPTTERERQLQEKAWGEGYAEGESDMLETLNELSRQQAEDWNSIETCDEHLEKELALVEKYPHYYKDIRHLNIIDIYRFFDLFEVTDPCLQHSMKKLAVGGKRGAKDYEKDIKEAMDTLRRWEYMQEENKRGMDD